MMIKIIKTGFIVAAFALFAFNSVVKTSSDNTSKVKLSEIVKINSADAECVDRGMMNNGYCTWTFRCVPDYGAFECLGPS